MSRLVNLGSGLDLHSGSNGGRIETLYAGTKKTLTVPANVGNLVNAPFITVGYNGETVRIATGTPVSVPAVIGDLLKAIYPSCTLV